MDKVTVLMAICETPGWQPPEDSSSIDRSLEELQREGWIAPRLDGYEATPEALDAYPDFGVDAQTLVIEARKPQPASGNGAHPEHVCVPLDKVVTLLAAMLQDLPVRQVYAYASVTAGQLPPVPEVWDIAQTLAGRMR